jgi:hypothetical protein
VGGFEAWALAQVEPTVKYHPVESWCLTESRDPGPGHWLVGSLTGAVASQKVTEAREGSLRLIGNQPASAMAQGSLTARPTGRAGGKPGHSDPVVLYGRAIAQRIKGTPGITGLSRPRVHIDGVVWHLDVGSSHPGAGAGPKGSAVRRLKRYASWVQNVVRQFGPYLLWAQEA